MVHFKEERQLLVKTTHVAKFTYFIRVEKKVIMCSKERWSTSHPFRQEEKGATEDQIVG